MAPAAVCRGILLLSAAALVPACVQAQTIPLDPASPGRIFQGIGAVSAGASSRLLIDYPEPQRSQVLDLLFTPGLGAGFQRLKVEVGGDINSTDGTEPSHSRSAHDRNFHRGYEWWLMEQAHKRNPAIVLEGLMWGAPAWLGTGQSLATDFFSASTAGYLADFIQGAHTAHRLDLQYVGIWNERSYDLAWIKLLRRTLDGRGLTRTGIVAADQINNWKLAGELATDPSARSAIAALGVHYPKYNSSPQAVALGLPLWSSEDGPWDGTWKGASQLARVYNRNYIQGRMTATEIWSPVTSYYDALPLPGSGVMRANTPWSGAFEVQPALWATAMTTRFVHPGWRYLDSACRLLPGGSVVALLSPSGKDFSVVFETTESKVPQTVTLMLDPALSHAALHLWRTTRDQPFFELPSVPVAGQQVVLSLDPDAIYTLSTVAITPPPVPQTPASRPFPLPWSATFAGYTAGATARYLADQAGAFEVAKEPRGHSKVLRQVIVQQGVVWEKTLHPETLFGDRDWTDYTVAVDARIPASSRPAGADPAGAHAGELPGTFITLAGRIRSLHANGRISLGYRLKIDGSGHWELSAETEKPGPPDKRGKPTRIPDSRSLAAGQAAALGPRWHRLSLSFYGAQIAASLDALPLARVEDFTFPAGMAGLGSGWHVAEYDHLKVTP